jgi:hypothetical protein
MWRISGPAENLLASQEMYFTDSDREECMLKIYSTDKPVCRTLNMFTD